MTLPINDLPTQHSIPVVLLQLYLHTLPRNNKDLVLTCKTHGETRLVALPVSSELIEVMSWMKVHLSCSGVTMLRDSRLRWSHNNEVQL